MSKKNCLIVRAAGRQLDLLRGEASRIARGIRSTGGPIVPDVGALFALRTRKPKKRSRSPATTSAFLAETAS